jgi:adenosylcobyric acid synthase
VTASTLMVQGTASSVGKSLLVAALCRMFRKDGLRVAPFKAQNMALNSAVTPDGLEIGRAQAVQADAAGIAATVDMNPVLLKPEGDRRSQVVVLGQPVGSMSAVEYHEYKPHLRIVIAEGLARLRATHDLIVIEGAGSPAEINLKDRDIVNMHVAKLARSPVLLVGDIDRGGVFAAFVGTLELLEPDERALVAAFVVNKFRGDVALLQPGLDFLTARTGKPVLGVVPYVPNLRIADEDSVSLEDRRGRRRAGPGALDIALVRLPRLSNYDDALALEHEPGVVVRFADHAAEVEGADLVIVPGSKNTIADLAWLRASGIAAVIEARARAGEPVLGICGGCQMLGRTIDDPLGVESAPGAAMGLGLLPIRTRFERTKVTAQVRARVATDSWLASRDTCGDDVAGYEIHMGTVEHVEPGPAPFELRSRSGRDVRVVDGAIGAGGAVIGTMIHGLFEHAGLRRGLLAYLRRRKGLAEPLAAAPPIAAAEAEYDRLEAAVRGSIDRALLHRILEAGAGAG